MIERLLTPGSIPDLAMRCVHGKAFVPLWWPSLKKGLRTASKKELSVSVVRQTKSAFHTNGPKHHILIKCQIDASIIFSKNSTPIR